MLDALQNPIVIAVVVLVLLILIAIPVIMRRRRAAREDVLPPPELGQAVDYTSLPYEEPQTLGERLAQAPIAVKLLLGLIPLALIIGGVVLYLTFFSGSDQAAVVPTPVPPSTITNVRATLTAPTRIAVEASTNLPSGTTVTASMKQGDQDLPWYNKDTASGKVAGGRVTVILEKAKNAPIPQTGQDQMVTLVATVEGQVVSSAPAKLLVPPIYARQFYASAAAAAPTATPKPTAVAKPTAAAAPTAAAQPTAALPTAVPVALKAKVFNGGNIRQRPAVENCANCPQLHAGEDVVLLGRSEDGKWYRVQAPDGEGWVSATLLTVDSATASQVPVATAAAATPAPTGLTAKVFNGGNVRARPIDGNVLDQINANETVQLLEKTKDGKWYRITNIRGVSGWVSVTLLTIDPNVAKQVPIAQ